MTRIAVFRMLVDSGTLSDVVDGEERAGGCVTSELERAIVTTAVDIWCLKIVVVAAAEDDAVASKALEVVVRTLCWIDCVDEPKDVDGTAAWPPAPLSVAVGTAAWPPAPLSAADGTEFGCPTVTICGSVMLVDCLLWLMLDELIVLIWVTIAVDEPDGARDALVVTWALRDETGVLAKGRRECV